jgi:hypothetical protein
MRASVDGSLRSSSSSPLRWLHSCCGTPHPPGLVRLDRRRRRRCAGRVRTQSLRPVPVVVPVSLLVAPCRRSWLQGRKKTDDIDVRRRCSTGSGPKSRAGAGILWRTRPGVALGFAGRADLLKRPLALLRSDPKAEPLPRAPHPAAFDRSNGCSSSGLRARARLRSWTLPMSS